MQKMNENFYELLGISKLASSEEIKRAFRKMSLLHHPDKNPGDPKSVEIFKKITEAYKVLSNKNERQQYDSLSTFDLPFSKMGGNVYAMNIDPNAMMSMLFGGSINDNGNIFDIPGFNLGSLQNLNGFNNLNNLNNNNNNNSFPGLSKHSYKSKPSTINKSIEISFMESFSGCKLPIDIERWVIESDIKCEETETLYVNIPKGIDNNEIITLEGKGNSISDNNKGDVKIKIIVNNSSDFVRNGIDLIYKKTISLKESLCGFSFDLKYVDGREFKINNEAGNIIPADFRKIIPKMGIERDSDIGNLIINFTISYPKKLSLEQVKKIEKIL